MRRIALIATVALVALAAPEVGGRHPWVVWNTTASAPIGLYRLAPDPRPRVGDLVVIRPPQALAAWLDLGGYAPLGVPLVKRVAAVAPSVVCRRGWMVTVDGRPIGLALPRGRRGEPLPAWRGCRRLAPGETFLFNPAQASLDSRYYGPLPATAILGRATPLWLEPAR